MILPVVDTMILRGGHVVDPANGVDEMCDIAVADGMIVLPADVTSATIVDVSGKVITPGLIDMHVHLRDPGETHKEDVLAGTRAAAVGGFTTIVAMPNTKPPIDSVASLARTLDRLSEQAVVHVLQSACLTLGRGSAELTDAAALRQAGAVALTDDGGCIQNAEIMLAALQQAAGSQIPVIDHCEDTSVAGKGVMHAGAVAQRLNLPGKNRSSEELVVARDIVLAREAGWNVHLQHLSSAGSIELVEWAQNHHIPVTAEVTPHHLVLTDEACIEYGTNAKMNPPLREERDREALIAGLKDGSISVIATDHAPHSTEEKDLPFTEAPNGIIGLETAIAICLTNLYHTGCLSLPELISKFTQGPRRILGLEAGTLSAGSAADITILDIDLEGTFETDSFHSKSSNCPYDGWKYRGKPVATLVGGKCIWHDSHVEHRTLT